jgi:hypothetical protein
MPKNSAKNITARMSLSAAAASLEGTMLTRAAMPDGFSSIPGDRLRARPRIIEQRLGERRIDALPGWNKLTTVNAITTAAPRCRR